MSEKLVELTSIKGAISNLILSMIGADKQRALDTLMFPTSPEGDYEYKAGSSQKLDYIHSLIDYYDNYQTGDSNNNYQTGCSTYYISNNILMSMLTLNKYVENVTYLFNGGSVDANDYGTPEIKNNISPYSYKFSSTLFQILKSNKFRYVDVNKSTIENVSEDKYKSLKFFDEDMSKIFNLKKVNDLLNDNIIMGPPNSQKFCDGVEKLSDYHPKLLVNDGLKTNSSVFLDNMEKLLLDLYKWYGMSEITGLFNILNNTEKTKSTLDLTLRISLQRVLTEFTNQITNNQSNPRKYLPLSEIFEDVIEQLSTINPMADRDDVDMFKSEDNNMNLYSVIEERIHLTTIGGTAIHSLLELIRRMKDENASDYMYSENVIRSNIADAIGLMMNLIKKEDKILIGDESNYENGTNLDNYTNDADSITGDKFNLKESLVKLQNLYDDVVFGIENGKFINPRDFNSLELDYLGLMKPLDYIHQTYLIDEDKYVILPPDSGKTSFYDTKHYSYQQTIHSKDEYIPTTHGNKYSELPCVDCAKECVNQFDYQASPEHCQNILAILVKLVIDVGYLYCIRNSQRISEVITTSSVLSTRSYNSVEDFINAPLPRANYSMLDIMKISELRNNLINKINGKSNNCNKKRTLYINESGNNGTITSEDIVTYFNDLGSYKNISSLLFTRICTMISYFGDEDKNTFDFDDVTKKGSESLLPFTRTIIYSFDEFFNTNDDWCCINTNNNNNLIQNNFEILTNALTYVASSIINDKTNKTGGGDKFTITDFELFITMLNYHFTTMTTFWSDEDFATINSPISDPSLAQSSLYPILLEIFSSNDEQAKNSLKNILKWLENITLITENVVMDNVVSFSITVPKYIAVTMKKIVEAPNLSSITQYIAFVTCHCIAGILSFFMNGTPLKLTNIISK